MAEKEVVAKKEVVAQKVISMVSMQVDGCCLIAGQEMPALTADAKKKLEALFGDKKYSEVK